jgi:hypothetical protein
MGIENFVRGAHNVCHRRCEYEMPDNFMTDFREVVLLMGTRVAHNFLIWAPTGA